MKTITATDLYDTEEIAEKLGITASRFRVARTRGDALLSGFPEPIRTISARPVWSAAAVDRWFEAVYG